MAGAGSSIGSIYARIGADTSDFQAKLAAGTISLNKFGTDAGRHGKAASTGLLMAGAAAGDVGRRLSAMAIVFDSVAGTSVSSYATIGRSALMMSRSVLEGANALMSMKTATSAVSAVVAAFGAGPVVGLVVAAAAAGAAIGTLLVKVTGTGALFTTASGPVAEYAKALAASEERFQGVAAQYEHMRASLKLSGPEWDFQAVRTKENAKRLAELIEAVEQHGRVVNATKSVRDGYTQYYIDLGNKIRDNQQKLATYTEQVNRFYGVVTKTDIRDQLKKTMVDLQVMQKEGIDAQQIIEAAGPKILEVIEQAKKMGVDVPPVLDNMAEAIKSKNNLWVGDLLRGMGTLPAAMREASAANAAELARVEAQFKSGIKGGFVDGTKEGLDSMQEQLAAAAANLKVRIPVEFASPDLETLIQSMIDGDRQKTTRSAR
jgi:hypothetical protein